MEIKASSSSSSGSVPPAMGSESIEVYFVFMNSDTEYERLKQNRTKEGVDELDIYLSKKHDDFLRSMFKPETYKKKLSLVIVDGFAVEITDYQAELLRGAKEVRLVEKNLELS
ncbi:subtilisin-like serine protease 3 [Zostera marina]|uniref:Subtilisin-like serine protease 3 n=1 Tax=Zostera marina TaxID=29655 RepID=A0A0K9NW83_ZOSMR|nr:subtilisin-like serine protease 3 [Zostera marina]